MDCQVGTIILVLAGLGTTWLGMGDGGCCKSSSTSDQIDGWLSKTQPFHGSVAGHIISPMDLVRLLRSLVGISNKLNTT